MESVIKALLEYVIANKEDLVKSRYSVVHLNDLGYRIHLSSLLGNVIPIMPAALVESIVLKHFPNVDFDRITLWFTILVNKSQPNNDER